MSDPNTNAWGVEAKVWAASAAALLVGLLVTILNEIPGDASLMGSLPGWAQGIITMVVPPAATFLSGWSAKHSGRPDLEVVVSPTAPNTVGK